MQNLDDYTTLRSADTYSHEKPFPGALSASKYALLTGHGFRFRARTTAVIARADQHEAARSMQARK